MDKLIQQKRIEDSIKQEVDQTLSDRASRYLQIEHHKIVPHTYFSAVSAECLLLFRDGYFYGCIALSQAVAEALVKFVCRKSSWKPAKKFEENVSTLLKRKIISPKLKEAFLRLWEERNDYHHLNINIETDCKKLEELAKKKIRFLAETEKEIFRFKTVDGKIVPEQPKYWEINENKTQVFLRLDI